MEMTEFEKAKQKDWDEFAKLNLTTKTELLKENIWFIFFGILIIFLLLCLN